MVPAFYNHLVGKKKYGLKLKVVLKWKELLNAGF